MAFAVASEAQVTKHALIIAIGDYPENSGWSKISSANDVPLIQGAYAQQGFTNFIVKQDAEATLKGIEQAFVDLEKSVKTGDIVAVHFSSHGQQIFDDNKDELDGYDEAIVTYGAQAYYDSNYIGKLHLRDEALGEMLNKIRTKLGVKGDVIVTVDACHSGTATRGGTAKSRGTGTPLEPKGYKPLVQNGVEQGFFSDSLIKTRGFLESRMSPMVIISAARADELNYEFEGKGSLSVAIARSMKNLGEQYSYRTLFSKILKEMSLIAPKQSPALEGDVDRLLFGGNIVKQQAYYVLKSLDYDAVRIDGGVFTGLNEGSTFSIYNAGTVSTKGKESLANGTITNSEGFESGGILDVELKGEAIEFWLFVDKKSFGNRIVKMSVGEGVSEEELIEKLAANKLISVVQKRDNPYFILELEKGYMTLIRTSDSGVYKDKIRQGDYRSLDKALTSFVQGRFIKELEIDNPDYNVEMELIPFQMKDGKVDTLTVANIEDKGGVPVFTTDMKAFIKITNHGDFDIYFNIVDIQPDGVINPLIPNPLKNENPADFKIASGQSYILPRNRQVSFGPPFGLETFKVFASYEPINLAPIITTRGNSKGGAGELSAIESMFQSSFKMTRGASVGNMPSDTDAATFSYLFRIAPQK
ncbi:MAG: hypothetical protein ACI8UQ_000889 [Bacteroidia bacterium]|jgi:hypothetical protein